MKASISHSIAFLFLFHSDNVSALNVSPTRTYRQRNNVRGYLPPRSVNLRTPVYGVKSTTRTTSSLVSTTNLYSVEMTQNDDSGISSTKSDLRSSSSTDIQVPLSLTLATGILTTLLGFAYAKCMKLGFRFIWKTIPSYFLRGDSTNVLLNLIRKHPAVYILLMTTCGGASVAYLSSLLPKLYTAHDYVHILSRDDPVVDDVNDEKDVFPSARFIWPLMGLCLLTSLSGFSLGPEAPMVRLFEFVLLLCDEHC